MGEKPKSEVARSHLTKAQAEATADEIEDAIQWSFASLEAAIDALAEQNGIATDQKHWKRTEAAEKLHADGVVPHDLSELHSLLNEERKSVFYEGEEPDLGDWSMKDVLIAVEELVEVAEGGNQ